MYYQETEDVRHDRMAFAVFLAVALHLLLILGLTFEAHRDRDYSQQLKVTLATRPSEQAPDEAMHIAQSDQVGSAETAEESQVSTPKPEPLPFQHSAPAREPQQAQADPRQSEQSLVTTTSLARDLVARESKEQDASAAPVAGINPEVDRLAQQVANLEATLDDQSRAYADRPRVRRLTSVSTKRAVDAAYLHDWRQRLEAVGNKYYPEASLRYGIYGELRLLVVVRQDGSLEDIQVLSSSGYAVLDEAAMKIVRLAAPFAPFPAELRATTDKLEIIRTWQFQENRLSSG